VADVEIKLITPIPVRVIVHVEENDRATLAKPAVASPQLITAVVEANVRPPDACTVSERQTTVVAVGTVTVKVAGITTSSAAVGVEGNADAQLLVLVAVITATLSL
jgi:archaeosine-15-forming tRNA-guanine transglycosylase